MGFISLTRDVLLGNQAVGLRSTTNMPTHGVGKMVGSFLLIIEARALSRIKRQNLAFVSVYDTCNTESSRP
jgi:hypothetical protein